MNKDKILITGANGQLGRVLAEELRKVYGKESVLATDISTTDILNNSPYEFLDIMNVMRLEEIIIEHKITQIYHMAAILSASGEWNPTKTWKVNFDGHMSVLEMAEKHQIEKVFFPSTIAVFGTTTPRENTAQHVPLMPSTVYGISKATGELWSNYYHDRYGTDIRSVRYPGIIGYQSLPSGGTTDYAVEIFHAAVKGEEYECFLAEDTRLPMMYMPDAIRATIELMQADKTDIKIRTSYNLAAMSFTPAEISESIRKVIPEFKIKYKPDHRQDIAASWTESIDDSMARHDWNWKEDYDLDAMTVDMIKNLRLQLVNESMIK